MTSRLAGRLVAIVALSAALIATGASAASAHSGLESSTPADGSVLTEAPQEISLTFDEELLADADSISINAGDGTNVMSAKVQPEGATISVPWPEGLAGGEYQVAFRVVSADGHPVTGAIGFTFAPAQASDAPATPESSSPAPTSVGTSEATTESTPTAMPISENAEPESTGGTPWLGLGIAVVIGLVLVVLFAAMRRRRA